MQPIAQIDQPIAQRRRRGLKGLAQKAIVDDLTERAPVDGELQGESHHVASSSSDRIVLSFLFTRGSGMLCLSFGRSCLFKNSFSGAGGDIGSASVQSGGAKKQHTQVFKEEVIMADVRSRRTGALGRVLATTMASGLVGMMLISLPVPQATAEPVGGIEIGAQRGERAGDRGVRDFGRAGRNNVIVRPGPNRVVVRPGVVRPARTVVIRPGYRVNPWWPRGGAIAAGAALGFIAAASAAAWAGPPPGPEYCWYYTDPSQRQGFWDYCR